MSKIMAVVKSKKSMFLLVILAALLLIAGGFFLYRHFFAGPEKSWMTDFDYREHEVHDLDFNSLGCPVIPVTVAGKQFPLLFDTGNDSGLLLTTLLEYKADYTLQGQKEQLNRDGSHRGWSRTVLIDEVSVFGDSHSNIETVLADWQMFSTEKINGTIGMKYFSSKVITLDYAAGKIAVSGRPVDYGRLKKYVVLPLLRSEQYPHLLFFEISVDQKPVTVYLDTGKNHSYLHNPEAESPGAGMKETPKKDITVSLKDMELTLEGLHEANLAHPDDLPYPVTIELNSDQIMKNKLIITIDMIEKNIIFLQ